MRWRPPKHGLCTSYMYALSKKKDNIKLYKFDTFHLNIQSKCNTW